MKENHNYDHSHQHENKSYNNIIFTMFLNLFFAILELLAFLLSGSMAMLSSSIHDFGDVLIFYFTAKVEKFSTKGRDTKYTYGYRRFTIIGAIINAIILIVGCIIIIPTSLSRLFNPHEIQGSLVLIMAFIGIIVNKIGVYKLKTNNSLVNEQLILNLKADVYNFYALFASSLLIILFDLQFMDALFAIIISIIMLIHVYEGLNKMFKIVMQSVPDDIDIDYVVTTLATHPKVIDIHDVHLWNLDGEDYIFTCHIVVADSLNLEEVITIREQLRKQLNQLHINHSTFEFDNLTIAKKNKEI